MFKDCDDSHMRAEKVADYFADYKIHQSHSLVIDRQQAREQGVVVEDLESDQYLQNAALTVHHATMHTFYGSAVKIVENHLGQTFAKPINQ